MNQHTPRPSLSSEIDANLKRAFDEMSKESVPDRFVELLSQLRSAEQAQASKEVRSED